MFSATLARLKSRLSLLCSTVSLPMLYGFICFLCCFIFQALLLQHTQLFSFFLLEFDAVTFHICTAYLKESI